MAEQRAEIFEHWRGERGRARHEEAHACGHGARGFTRDIEEPHVDRRHSEEERGLEGGEFLGGLLVLEAFEKAHAATGGEPAMQAIAESVDVE